MEAKITRWTSHEFARFKAYSTARVGDNPEGWWDALGARAGSRLHFTGEHCSRTGIGCVHGVYEMGEIAVRNVLKILELREVGD